MNPLNVLFLWHMHQPTYQIDSESFLMPWTRLHAIKDYIGMIKLVEEFPKLAVTFNFTPILWEQLHSYANGSLDRELEISRKCCDMLEKEEKLYLYKKIVNGSAKKLTEPYPRFSQLCAKLMPMLSSETPERVLSISDDQELRDLIVWRSLAWIYPDTRSQDSFLQEMLRKGRGYTENEKQMVLDQSIQIIRSLPNLYRTLQEKNQIELSTSPYYHPILPILIDSESAREAIPKIQLPTPFSFVDDAEWQVEAAIRQYQQLFHRTPSGVWPSEGAVSQASAELLAKCNIFWMATDENLLAQSLGLHFVRDGRGQINHPDLLYRPWKVNTPNGFIHIIFRDHLLSDLIGFDYQRWDPKLAVDDFESRLMAIHERLNGMPFPPCVAIILDGENAWEHYMDGGFGFLRKLYHRLLGNAHIRLRTISEYIHDVQTEIPIIPRLAAGSWINGNLGIWIGHPEENNAWSLVKDASLMLKQHSDMMDPETIQKCRSYLRKAQSSDWYWWYGDDHYTPEKADFDFLFRHILMNVYQLTGESLPELLKRSLLQEKSRRFKLVHPKMLISPKIDGRLGRYYDWFGAGSVAFRRNFSAMHSSDLVIFESMKFGFDLEHFYLRLDPGDGFRETILQGISVVVRIAKPHDYTIHLRLSRTADGEYFSEFGEITSEQLDHYRLKTAIKDVLELSIPFDAINAHRNEQLEIYVELYSADRFMGRIPDMYGIECRVPTEDYDARMWEV